MPPTDNLDAEFLAVVTEMRQELADALNSLEGKTRNGVWDSFLGFSAIHIDQAAHGYLHLRQASLIGASKLLIRPALEAMFRIQAVRAVPYLLYRIAYTEHSENLKFVRPAAKRLGQDCEADFKASWESFTVKYVEQFPGHTLEKATLSAFAAAEAAQIGSYYDCAYRLYCQFTHGAMRATTGGLGSTDTLDNRTMAFCVWSALEAVVSIGGRAPRLASLRDRLTAACHRDDQDRTSNE